ncbi:MAG: inorganic phosphate transporter, partial [Microcoleus sp.]
MLNTSGGEFLQLAAIAALALYVAANLGANDVANSMGTSVGSKALTLRQAIIVAGILEFAGAVLFGKGVSETLATGVVNAEAFAAQPQVFLIGMVSVLAACGLWLQIATRRGLPVSSSHAVVGAIAGFSWVAAGIGAVDWPTIGTISLTWLATPVASGAVAALFYSLVKYSILDRPDPLDQMREWIPWLSAAVLSIFGIIVLPSVVDVAFVQTGAIALVQDRLGWNIPVHDIVIGIGGIGAIVLTQISWKKLADASQSSAGEKEGGRGKKEEGRKPFDFPQGTNQEEARKPFDFPQGTNQEEARKPFDFPHGTNKEEARKPFDFPQGKNQEEGRKPFDFPQGTNQEEGRKPFDFPQGTNQEEGRKPFDFPQGTNQEEGIGTNSPTLPLPHSLIEQQMARFQVISACFVAFAHGSNDVGNAVAPLAAIAYIRHTGSFPQSDFSVPLWILVLGGVGIVAGLSIWGKNVIATVGEGIIELQPSGGFCAELATAATVLLASRLGLPVSTSHALVGAVVGVGIVKGW